MLFLCKISKYVKNVLPTFDFLTKLNSIQRHKRSHK